MNRGVGIFLGVSVLLVGLLLTLGVILSVVIYDAGVAMLLGLLFAAAAMISGAVLLVRLSDRRYPDDLIAANAGLLWAAPLMGMITLFFYYLLVHLMGALLSFLMYEATIVAVTALLVWRPWYPFGFSFFTLNPYSLSPARLRVLSFLRSRECMGAGVRASVWMTFGLLVVTLGFIVLQHAGYLAATKPEGFKEPWGVVAVGVMMSLIPVALTAFSTHVGAVLYHVIARWDYIQATYPPFPPLLVRKSFYMGSSKREFSGGAPSVRASENPVDGIVQAFRGFVHWKRAAGLLCWSVGLLTLFFGFSRLVESLQSAHWFSSHASMRLVLYVLIPGFLLLVLGRRWWRRP